MVSTPALDRSMILAGVEMTLTRYQRNILNNWTREIPSSIFTLMWAFGYVLSFEVSKQLALKLDCNIDFFEEIACKNYLEIGLRELSSKSTIESKQASRDFGEAWLDARRIVSLYWENESLVDAFGEWTDEIDGGSILGEDESTYMIALAYLMDVAKLVVGLVKTIRET